MSYDDAAFYPLSIFVSIFLIFDIPIVSNIKKMLRKFESGSYILKKFLYFFNWNVVAMFNALIIKNVSFVSET